MDDPWGSPWTNAIVSAANATHEGEKPSRLDSDSVELKTTTTALTTAPTSINLTAPTISVFSGTSPWADDADDDFGDWADAGASATTTTKTAPSAAPLSTGLDFGGWPSPGRGLRSSSQSAANGSSSPWSGAGLSIPSTNLDRAAQNDVGYRIGLGYPSPDPWASVESTTDGFTGVGAVSSVLDLGSPQHKDNELSLPSSSREVEERQTRSKPGIERQDRRVENLALANEVEDPLQIHSLPSETNLSDVPHRRSSSDVNGHAPSPNSPITSVEDEETDLNMRKMRDTPKPTKVQELVVMFDGLMRTAVEPEPLSRVSSATVRSQEKTSGSEVDLSLRQPHERLQESSDLVTDLLPASDVVEDVDVAEDLSKDAARTEDAPTCVDSSPSIDPSGLEFKLDLDLIPQLFPSPSEAAQSQFPLPAVDDVSDRIVLDSFSTISERKAWYRISRATPLRQHNFGGGGGAGDEDGYVRISWSPSSVVRHEVVTIVRRWMEQDSIAGGRAALAGTGVSGVGFVGLGVGLGFGGKNRNLFGWDSTAPAVDLEEVFGRKHQRQKSSISPGAAAMSTPTSSTSTGTTKAGWTTTSVSGRRASRTGSKDMTKNSVATSSPTPAFGWSSVQEVVESPASMQPPALKSLPKPAAMSIPPPKTAAAGAVVAKQNAAPAPIQTRPFAVDDDDDDWGELVSATDDTPPAKSDAIKGPVPSAVAQPQSLISPVHAAMISPIRQDSMPFSPTTLDLAMLGGSANAQTQAVSHSESPRVGSRLSLDRESVGTEDKRGQSKANSLPFKILPEGESPSMLDPPALGRDEEQTAARLIAGLPNLAYMLR